MVRFDPAFPVAGMRLSVGSIHVFDQGGDGEQTADGLYVLLDRAAHRAASSRVWARPAVQAVAHGADHVMFIAGRPGSETSPLLRAAGIRTPADAAGLTRARAR